MTKDPTASDVDVDHVRRLLERLEHGLEPDYAEDVGLAPTGRKQLTGATPATPLKIAGDQSGPSQTTVLAKHAPAPRQAVAERRRLVAGLLIASVAAAAVYAAQTGVPFGNTDGDRQAPASAPQLTSALDPKAGAAGRRATPDDAPAPPSEIEQPVQEQPGATGTPPASLDREGLPPRLGQSGLPSGEAPLTEASAALLAGRVEAARTLLGDALKRTPDNPDLLWALARTYSPAVLSGIDGADRAPDAQEVERVLRRWHAVSVAQGLIAPNVAIDRILLSLQADPGR